MTKVSILQIIAVVVGNFKSCRNSVFDHLQHQIKVSTIYKRHPKKKFVFRKLRAQSISGEDDTRSGSVPMLIKVSFPLKISSVNVIKSANLETANLVTFTEETLLKKTSFFVQCSKLSETGIRFYSI